MRKTKFSHRVIALFLTISFLQSFIPYNMLLASNNGPNAPEASGFEPVSATDMVNLSSGDMAYVLPLLEIDGFPVTLSYHAGIPMDMEASWAGLGWNINTGAIARGVSVTPDDWKNGKRLNLMYLTGKQDSYSVNVGVGIARAAEVGVGLSWGPNKSLSGSVSASIGPVSASIDTNGNYNIGVGAGALTKGAFDGVFDKVGSGKAKEGSPFGGGLSISGNVNKGGISANIGVSRNSGNVSGSMGISISGNGVGASYSIGSNNGMQGTDTSGGGGGMSVGSFSAGDFSYNSKGFYVPIQIGIFSFGFGFNRTIIELKKAASKYGYGVLYHADPALYNDTNLSLGEAAPDTGTFTDYKKRNEFGDVYEQVLPQPEEEFIGDYSSQIERLNFTFAGYDSYSINATGIGGTLRPLVAQNTVLIAEGYDGESTRMTQFQIGEHLGIPIYKTLDKTKIFYHHGGQSLKQDKSLSGGNLHFVFDGQTTENAFNQFHSIKNTIGSDLDLGDFINRGTYSVNNRPKAGSYVETFTNAQIDAGGTGLLTPASLYVEGGNDLSRNSQGYMPDGIGGYKITTPDGKVYHFSQPVYHYEQIQHNFMNFEGTESTPGDEYNSSSKREATPYATHWLLTAITGPDFIDINNNNFADKDDYGYWVRLDHGRWSNAYTWRSPYDNGNYTLSGSNAPRRHYATFIDQEVEKSDPGYFLQGRKDLYYLDKIVSKSQTAYFVKDIRYDAVGTSAPYAFGVNNFPDKLEGNNANTTENALYDKEYQLKLDKIVIVNNKPGTEVSPVRASETLRGLVGSTKTSRYTPGGFFDKNLDVNQATPINRIHQLHQSNQVIDVEDFQNFDYRNALKVIKFNHDYRLAKHTPSSGYNKSTGTGDYSENPQAGRLTLNSVKTFGRGLFDGATENDLYDYMPPYQFIYLKPDLPHEENTLEKLGPAYNLTVFGNLKEDAPQYKLNRANKDNWGFRNAKIDTDNDGVLENSIDAWSLASITTPQGAKIEVEYEEDDFYTEAFGRRYWENNLKFLFQTIDTEYYRLTVEIQDGFAISNPFSFADYFDPTKKVFMDLWACKNDNEVARTGTELAKLNITVDDQVTIETVSQNQLTLKVKRVAGIHVTTDGEDLFNQWMARGDTYGLNYESVSRGECPSDPAAGKTANFGMLYKLLSNKVAPGTSGGGLRVKKITVNNLEGHQYITSYDYTDPNTGESSGITSFNPVHGEVFVPYQNELPGPGVMYEWVTMTASGINDSGNEEELSKIRYHYYTLKLVEDIFNPDINMVDKDGLSIFKTQVTPHTMSLDKLTAKNMSIEKDLSKIGQLISTEEFNSKGQLMNKSVNTYISRDGELSETFSSMKSVFDFDEDDNGNQQDILLFQRYLAQSTKSEKVSVVSRIDNYANGIHSSVTYDDPDEYLGTYRSSIRTTSVDGRKIKEEKIPAYEVYPDMGPKTSVSSNKNMLTQEAMNITSVSDESDASGNPINWKTISANVTAWKDSWDHIDNNGTYTTQNGIWRKHQNFVWKDAVDNEGTYGSEITSSDFNWGIGATQSNTQWQKVSEITRYTLWSSPVETMDINGNFAASKMADQFTKVTAGGNARYSELYYSGAEHLSPLGQNYYDGEVKGANYQSTEQAHTGMFSSKVSSSSHRAFEVTGTVGSGHSDLSKTFRPGVYKVSVWAYSANGEDAGTKLRFNSRTYEATETAVAGDWTLYNFYVELDQGTTASLYVYNTTSGNAYYDDFRMHPVYASMNSYVYDLDTEELTHILDANNLATRFRYDDAGRLCKTYKEVIDTPTLTGGFKITNSYKYNYENIYDTECMCCDPGEEVNFNPEANDDAITMPYYGTLEIEVLSNDNFGGDGPATPALSVTNILGPGTAVVDDRGTPTIPSDDFIRYTLNTSTTANLVAITYQLCDGNGDCDTAVANIDISNITYNYQPVTATSLYIYNTINKPYYIFNGNLQGLSGGSGDFSFNWAYDIATQGFTSVANTTSNGFSYQYDPATSDLCVPSAQSIRWRCTVTDNITGEVTHFDEAQYNLVSCEQL